MRVKHLQVNKNITSLASQKTRLSEQIRKCLYSQNSRFTNDKQRTLNTYLPALAAAKHDSQNGTQTA